MVGLVLIGVPAAAPAQTASKPAIPHTPKVGSPLRRAILASLRVPVQRMLKGPVVFSVRQFKVQADWAFVLARPRRPNGEAVDYANTKWAEVARDHGFRDEIAALMRRRGKPGGKYTRWRVVWFTVGTQSQPWRDWAKRYRAPAAIFPPVKNRSVFE